MSKEQVKMKSGMSYTCKEKTIILNVFQYFRKIFPEESITHTVTRTSEATGCSEKSIFKFRKEANSPEGFKEPYKRKKRPLPYTNSRSNKYDESIRESIRNILRNNEPTMSNILKCVNSDEKLPSFKQSTLRRLLFDMGFTFEWDKSAKKNILVETGTKKIQKRKAKPSKRVPKDECLVNFVKCESTELKNTSKTLNNYEYVTQTVNQPVLEPLMHNSQSVIQSVPDNNSLYGQKLVFYTPMAALDYQHKMFENHSTLDSSIHYSTGSFNHISHCKIEP